MQTRGATIEISLGAIARNYRALRKHYTGQDCGAVVKANAYGLGALEVSRRLLKEDCKHFFVATLDEALALKPYLGDAQLFVFNGPLAGEETEFTARGIIPVINSISQLGRWRKNGEQPYILHVDTGMTRLGVSLAELKTLAQQANQPPMMLMSHLACAGEPENPANRTQLENMLAVQQSFPGTPISFCNSSGIFLPGVFHFDLARPGCSLYGITPFDHAGNPMENVVHLTAPIIQLRDIIEECDVGYGGTGKSYPGMRIATVALGYADGLLRHLSNVGKVYVGDKPCPILGRVSMDMVMVDVTGIEGLSEANGRVSVIGSMQPVDAVARAAGTIGYEIFTRLGERIKKVYREEL